MSLVMAIGALAEAVGADIKALLESLAGKQDTLTSGANIKTINGESLLGDADIELVTQANYDATVGDISAALTTINGA